jgi:gamma-glutamyltranspeptidase/glutathione hydrolase
VLVGDDASSAYEPEWAACQRSQAEQMAGAGEPTPATPCTSTSSTGGEHDLRDTEWGWLYGSPVIPALGWPLGTRAQMFWLEEGLPSSLRPGARPHDSRPGSRCGEAPWLAWGTPSGDQQEQRAFHVFLRHVDRGLNLQEAIDAPEFHTDHLISSFYPRGFLPRSLAVESRFPRAVNDELRARGHEVTEEPDWSLGRVTAVESADGQLRAAANPRGMQGYAAGR